MQLIEQELKILSYICLKKVKNIGQVQYFLEHKIHFYII